jgi:hypothetical protein
MINTRRFFLYTTAGLLAGALAGLPAANVAAQSSDVPGFQVDPDWPKPLPNNWRIGQVGGMAVDRNDNIWVVQRPRSLTSDEAGATDATTEVCEDGSPPSNGTCADGSEPVAADAFGNPRPFGPIADCCLPAPSVLQFDPDGNLLQAWGGPVHRDPDWGWPEPNCTPPACEWPAGEHGIFVDQNDNVYIAGNGFGDGSLGSALNDRGWDGQVLKFAADGTFLLQVGAAGNDVAVSNDTSGGLGGTPQLWRPADTEVDPATNELYIADGYGNHRVVVVDAETGMYKRHWGAYGQKPVDDAAADAVGPYAEDRDAGVTPQNFRNPVHCVRITGDDKVYVCDRPNDRLQVFDKRVAGTERCSLETSLSVGCGGFIEEKFIRPDTLGPGSVWDLDTSTDRRESCLYNADGTNMQVDILFRQTLEILDSLGRPGRNAGEFHWVHNVATDSDGNIYTAEVDTGKRAQKFERVSDRNSCQGAR